MIPVTELQITMLTVCFSFWDIVNFCSAIGSTIGFLSTKLLAAIYITLAGNHILLKGYTKAK